MFVVQGELSSITKCIEENNKNVKEEIIVVPKRKIVSEDELYYIKILIRTKLVIENLSISQFEKIIFEGYTEDEKITTKELKNYFAKKPLNLSSSDSEILARYLIEPRDFPEIEVKDLYLERIVSEVKQMLNSTLGISYNLEEINLEIVKKNLMIVRFFYCHIRN